MKRGGKNDIGFKPVGKRLTMFGSLSIFGSIPNQHPLENRVSDAPLALDNLIKFFISLKSLEVL
jgi:hypothetical protein